MLKKKGVHRTGVGCNLPLGLSKPCAGGFGTGLLAGPALLSRKTDLTEYEVCVGNDTREYFDHIERLRREGC